MKQIRRILRLYRIFIGQHLKRLMEYKVDFLAGAIAFLLGQLINILFINIIFSQIPTLAGWRYEEIVFIYGFSLIPKGLDHLLTDNLWKVGWFIVRKGDFDKYLTRPINPLLHVIMEEFQVDAFGELLLGIVLVSMMWQKVNMHLSFIEAVLFVGVILFAALIYTGLKIISSAIALWIKQSGQIMQIVYMSNDFAKYPTTIYNGLIRSIITYILPFAFTAYYPALYFLTKKDPLFNLGGTVIASIILFAVGYKVWCRGLKAYESAGS